MVHVGVLGLLVLVVGASAQGLFEFPHRSQEDITNRPGFLTSVPIYRPNTSCRPVLPGLWRCVNTQPSEDEPFLPPVPRTFNGDDSDELSSDDDSDMEGPRTSTVIVSAGPPAPRRRVVTLGDIINRIRARVGLPPLRIPESSPEQSEEREASFPKDDSEEQPHGFVILHQRPEITVEPEGLAVRRRTIIMVVRHPDSSESKDSDEDATVGDTTTAEPIETTTNDDVTYGTSGDKVFRGPRFTTSAPPTVPPTVMVTTPSSPAPTETTEWKSTEGTTSRVASSTENEIDTSTSFETTTPRMKMVDTKSESREELDMPEDVEILQRRNGNRQRLIVGKMKRFKYQPSEPSAMHV